MNVDQARAIFEREFMASMPDCGVVEAATREFSGCFAFFYQSQKFLETGNFSESLVGQGAVLISRENGQVFETGSAYPTEHYVNAFDACGDPLGKLTDKVKITGWSAGADKIQANKLVREKSGLGRIGLSRAKGIIDSVLRNEEVIFTAMTIEDAEDAVAKLRKLGFVSIQLWNNQT